MNHLESSTSIPSTSIPSTSIPSTSIPSTSIPSTTLKYYDGTTHQIQQQYVQPPNHEWLHRPQISNDDSTNQPPTQPTQPLTPVQSYNHIGFNNKSMCRTKYDSHTNRNYTPQYIPHGYNICPDQGIGDINALNDLRTGEHSRIEGYRYGEFVNDMFLDIESTNVFINTSVMPFPRGGVSTRKLNRENSKTASNNI